MMSVTANACGGITIKGNSGASYCLSKQTMNWYSAYAWCHDQGMKLIDLAPVCGRNSGTCSELKLSDSEKTHIIDNGGTVSWGWTNTSSSSNYTFYVNLSSGTININYRNLNDYYALCF